MGLRKQLEQALSKIEELEKKIERLEAKLAACQEPPVIAMSLRSLLVRNRGFLTCSAIQTISVHFCELLTQHRWHDKATRIE